MMVVNGCSCGLAHRLSDEAYRKLKHLQRTRGETVPFGNVYGCWRVPRVYIACHGLGSQELRVLAERYGWPEVT